MRPVGKDVTLHSAEHVNFNGAFILHTKGCKPLISKLEHIGVMVKDMDVSIRFYTEVLGMSLVDRVRLSEEVELGFLSFPGTEHVQIELVTRGRDDMTADGHVDHIAFTVTDIEAEFARLRSLGVTLIDEKPRYLPALKATIAFFCGPDGERLEFFQR